MKSKIILIFEIIIIIIIIIFERFFKVKKNGVFRFGISFFVIEIFTFLYYANEEN